MQLFNSWHFSVLYSYVLFQMAAFTACMLILHDKQSKITSNNSIESILFYKHALHVRMPAERMHMYKDL